MKIRLVSEKNKSKNFIRTGGTLTTNNLITVHFDKGNRSYAIERRNRYRRLTRFYPPLTRFYPPIISSISDEFALREKYVVFWHTNLQLIEENSHYHIWLKSLCSWVKARQRWVKTRQATVPLLLTAEGRSTRS